MPMRESGRPGCRYGSPTPASPAVNSVFYDNTLQAKEGGATMWLPMEYSTRASLATVAMPGAGPLASSQLSNCSPLVDSWKSSGDAARCQQMLEDGPAQNAWNGRGQLSTPSKGHRMDTRSCSRTGIPAPCISNPPHVKRSQLHFIYSSAATGSAPTSIPGSLSISGNHFGLSGGEGNRPPNMPAGFRKRHIMYESICW